MPALTVFTKPLRDKSPAELGELGRDLGLDGWDLCLRQGYPVNPQNVTTALPEAVKVLGDFGLSVPMLEGEANLLSADDATAAPIAAAMARAKVPLLKIGYFGFDPATQDYNARMSEVRQAMAGWEKLARQHGIQVAYHTHIGMFGVSGAMMREIVQGFDPKYIGAFIDAAHLALEGERFGVAAAAVKEHLCAAGLKDFVYERAVVNAHGRVTPRFVVAGHGVVDFTAAFEALARLKFTGPISASANFQAPPEGFLAGLRQEVGFYRRMMRGATAAG